MSQDFSGKQIVVTGATRGIGEACARRFAQLGGRVALTGRDEERLGNLQAELPNGPIAIPADLSTEAGVDHVVEEVLSRLGGVDVLVNNAGTGIVEPADELSAEAIDETLAVNVRSVLLLSSRLANSLIARRGNIINLSSISSLGGTSTQAAYVASKGAIDSLTINLAREWGQHGVRVNAIAPGYIVTDIWASTFDAVGEEAVKQELVQKVPLGRWGDPAEIASVACFLASDEASYISGHTLRVDGAVC